MASSSFAMEDARRHLRKEEFDLIYPPGNSTGKGPRRVPVASMHRGDRRARGAIDYCEYYPKCVRSCFPQVVFFIAAWHDSTHLTHTITSLMISQLNSAACGKHDHFTRTERSHLHHLWSSLAWSRGSG